MRRILLFSSFMFVALTSCEDFNDPESPYSEQYVVFGNISGNMPMIDDTIFVSRSASLDEKVDANNLWITNADITISGDGEDYIALPISGRPGRYQTDHSVIFKSGIKYKLSVKINFI